MKRKVILITIVVVALIGAGGIVLYYNYQNTHYVKTDNAQVAAETVTVTPQAAGKVVSWKAKVGDKVKKGTTLGTVRTTTVLGTTEDVKVKAPIKGTVIQSDAVVGQMASTSTTVATIAKVADAYITANIKETDIANVKKGQQVSISVDAYPGTTLAGKVERIGQAAESVFSLLPSATTSGDYTKETQLISVKIKITDREDLALMPGMNASVEITR